jgi:hypothetical protein
MPFSYYKPVIFKFQKGSVDIDSFLPTPLEIMKNTSIAFNTAGLVYLFNSNLPSLLRCALR